MAGNASVTGFRVEVLLTRASDLDEAALLRMAATLSANRTDELATARHEAAEIARNEGLSRSCDEFSSVVTRWATNDGARSGGYSFASPANALRLADARRAAAPAVLDAAIALLLGSRLSASSRRVLLKAWDGVSTS